MKTKLPFQMLVKEKKAKGELFSQKDEVYRPLSSRWTKGGYLKGKLVCLVFILDQI